MKKQNPVNETSPEQLPRTEDMAAEQKAIHDQALQAIEYHSHPEKMTFSDLTNIDDL